MIYMTTSYWGDITVMLINFAYQKFSMNTRVIEIYYFSHRPFCLQSLWKNFHPIEEFKPTCTGHTRKIIDLVFVHRLRISTPQKSDLNRHHLKSHTPLTPNLPPKVTRLEPHIANPQANDKFSDQNTQQRGFGLPPTDVPDVVRQFFHDEQPWGTDQNLRQIYVRNFHRIRDTETIN